MTTSNRFSQFYPTAPFGPFLSDGPYPFLPTGGADSPFADILEEEPDIPYYNVLGRAKLSPNQREHFRSQRNNIFNQFQGLLGEQIRTGQEPSARFADYMANYNFVDAFRQLPREQRESRDSMAAPRTRFLRD